MSIEQLMINGIESEIQVVGGVYCDEKVLDDIILDAKQFSDSRIGNTFHIMKKLRAKGVMIDINSVLAEAGSMKVSERIGGSQFQTELASIFSVSNIKYHESVVIDNYKTRTFYKVLNNSIDNISSKGYQNARDALEEAIRNLDSQTVISTNTGHVKEILNDVVNDMFNDDGSMQGSTTGYDGLDQILNGFQKQDLFLIGGRPSMGKTAFVMNALRNHAANGGIAALFSIEMPGKSIVKRLLASEGNIKSVKFRNPKNSFDDKDWDKLIFAAGELSEMELYVYEEPIMDISYIRSKCALLRKENPEGDIVVAVDYLQIIKTENRFGGNKTSELGAVSTGLKQIAREFDLTMIALSQLSRDVEKRDNKRPIMSDIRESGQIEQD